MVSQGPNFPNDVINVVDWGIVPWDNPQNVKSENSIGSMCYVTDDEGSNKLVCRGFNFSIPEGSTINGIKVEIKSKSINVPPYYHDDWAVFLTKPYPWTPSQPWTEVGENKARTGIPYTSNYAWYTYGGQTDLWTIGWTPEEINDFYFGVIYVIKSIGTNYGSGFDCDAVKITVYYTEVPPTPPIGHIVNVNVDGIEVFPTNNPIPSHSLGESFVITSLIRNSGGVGNIRAEIVKIVDSTEELVSWGEVDLAHLGTFILSSGNLIMPNENYVFKVKAYHWE
jgi:hypothetical protein